MLKDARRPRARIRDAATQLFYDTGYHATTMRQIADAVGMKAGSLYNHYAGKEDILYEIASETMLELLDEGKKALADAQEPEERLRGLVNRHVQYHAKHRLQAKVADDQLSALSPDRRAEVVAIRDEYEGLFKRVLRDGSRRSGWRIPDVSVIAFGIATMGTGVGTWFREGGRLAPQEVAEIYADFVLDGVGCRRRSRRTRRSRTTTSSS